MNTATRDCFYIIAVCFLLLMLTSPSCATPIPIVIRGTVVEMNATSHKMTLDADCEKFSCQYNLTGRFEGYVPNDAVYPGIQNGEVVEAVFKDWIMKVTNSTIEFVWPSDGTRNIRQWYSVQRLAYGDDGNTLVGTEIFGDPGYLETPLDGNYEISYRLFGPDPKAYDYQTFPVKTVANTSVKKKSGFNESKIFTTGETYDFSDTYDNTTISMQFIGGYNAEFAEPKACPCANFHIRVISDDEIKPVIMHDKPITGSSNKSAVTPLGGIVALAALVFFSCVIKRR